MADIMISMNELRAAGFESTQQFSQLYLPQRRRVIAKILRDRGDERMAYLVEMNNPNAQTITVVH